MALQESTATVSFAARLAAANAAGQGAEMLDLQPVWVLKTAVEEPSSRLGCTVRTPTQPHASSAATPVRRRSLR